MADEQRTLSLGVQSTIFRAFGSVPGPIIFGVIFDSACVYWQYECSRRGNCWVYDNQDLSLRAFSIGVTGVSVNCLFSFLTWLVYPRDRDNGLKAGASESDIIPKGSQMAVIKGSVFSDTDNDVDSKPVFSDDPLPANGVESNAVFSDAPSPDNALNESKPIEIPTFGDIETTVVSL